jgi:hypothetical protein
MKRIMAAALAVFFGQLLFGCGDDNEVDRTFDCGSICARYSDCVTDIDLTECTDHCEDEADRNPNIEQAVDACDDCIEGRSCAEAAECIPDCALVPVPS